MGGNGGRGMGEKWVVVKVWVRSGWWYRYGWEWIGNREVILGGWNLKRHRSMLLK
jgi:hypothetical protein